MQEKNKQKGGRMFCIVIMFMFGAIYFVMGAVMLTKKQYPKTLDLNISGVVIDEWLGEPQGGVVFKINDTPVHLQLNKWTVDENKVNVDIMIQPQGNNPQASCKDDPANCA